MNSTTPEAIQSVLDHARRQNGWRTAGLSLAAIIAGLALARAGVLDPVRYADAMPTVLVLLSEALPPDFSRWRDWVGPLLDTLAMGWAGTLLGALLALPLGALAARGIGPSWLRPAVLLLLNTSRSIPGLVWGIVFVAAVGFGPLPGVFALACHSTGTLGKFCAEMLEHVDPAPGAALRSMAVSELGVLRFAIWPQLFPRWADALLYRFEHNIRAATTLGAVGAGGIGLEIITAFHLFEYREALALLLLLLALVSTINAISAYLRGGLLGLAKP